MSVGFLRRAITAVAVAALGLAFLVVPGVSSATTARQDKVVSDNPVNWTPHALDNSVRSIVQVGDTIVTGGDFTKITDRDQTAEIPQASVFAFNATNGDISTGFRPQLTGGTVEALAPHPDGDKVWVAGTFTTVNGVKWPKLALLRLSDGSLVTSFAKTPMNGKVRDLAVVGNRLIVGGTFSTFKGVAQGQLAALRISDGAYDPFISLPFTGKNNGGTTAVAKFDVSADGTKLVAVGNFTAVAGQARGQVAVLDLTGSSATLANWATARFPNVCSSSFDTYLRDVDIDPDGSYFVIVTTGAYRSGTLCDTASRWELRATGTGLQPTWIDYTGGDTEYSVAVTGTAVYVGGHQRWHNNSFKADQAGPGAVAREGIAALDPVNGLPISWNPGRDRGIGAYYLGATEAGLWVGSDTDRLGRYEYHGRVGFFPLLGGKSIPRPVTGTLPGRTLSLGTGAAPITARDFDGTTAGAPVQTGSATTAKAAMMISSQMYLARSNGSLEVASWDGTSLGTPAVIPDLGITAFKTDLANMTGMFFRQGRLYYTVSNSSSLFYRYFTPESGVIGADRFTASASVSGLNYSTVRGMFASGDDLYWVESSTGDLKKTAMVNGLPAAGQTTTVSGPANGIDWRQGPLTLEAFAEAVPHNDSPIAVANVVCEGAVCHFTSSGSQDPDGQLVERVWDFGDGTQPFGEGAAIDHTYADDGTFTAKLTVRDADGAEASTTVQAQPNAAPVAVPKVTCDALTCELDGTASTDGSKPAIDHNWDLGDGTGIRNGDTATYTYDAPGTYTITLTVKDDEGGSASATKTVTVVAPATQIDFLQSATATANAASIKVNTPSSVVTNDALVLIASGNRSDVTYGDPGAGWTEVKRVTDGDLTTIAWQKVADDTDAGKQVTVTASAAAKMDLQLLVYRGTDRQTPVVDSAAAAEPGSTADHTTPTVNDAPAGAVTLSYWADKSSTTTAWTPPQDTTQRGQSAGSGTGRITSLSADQQPLAQAGQVGGLTATANSAAGKATMLTLVLGPKA